MKLETFFEEIRNKIMIKIWSIIPTSLIYGNNLLRIFKSMEMETEQRMYYENKFTKNNPTPWHHFEKHCGYKAQTYTSQVMQDVPK